MGGVEKVWKHPAHSLLETARSSADSLKTLNNLSGAERLMHVLNRHFPERDMRDIEDMAHEIQLYRTVEKLDSFGRSVRLTAKDYLYARMVEERKIVDEALSSFYSETLPSVHPSISWTTEGTDIGKNRTVLKKPCIRVSGDEEAKSHSERLSERLSSFYNRESERDRLIVESEQIGSKEELQEFLLDLSVSIGQKMEDKAKETRESINSAVNIFIEQIKLQAKEYDQVTEFIEAMRKMEEEMEFGYSDHTTSAIYLLSKKIKAHLNKSNDKVDDEVCNQLNHLLDLVKEVKPKLSGSAKQKATELEKKAQDISACK